MTSDEILRLILGVITVIELIFLPFIIRSIFQEKAFNGPRCRFCELPLELKQSKKRGWCEICEATQPPDKLATREQEYSLALKTFGDEYFQ